jgi:hypothetical protein
MNLRKYTPISIALLTTLSMSTAWAVGNPVAQVLVKLAINDNGTVAPIGVKASNATITPQALSNGDLATVNLPFSAKGALSFYPASYPGCRFGNNPNSPQNASFAVQSDSSGNVTVSGQSSGPMTGAGISCPYTKYTASASSNSDGSYTVTIKVQ